MVKMHVSGSREVLANDIIDGHRAAEITVGLEAPSERYG
jgi:hypothetical protein